MNPGERERRHDDDQEHRPRTTDRRDHQRTLSCAKRFGLDRFFTSGYFDVKGSSDFSHG